MASIMNRAFGINQHSALWIGREGRGERKRERAKDFFFAAYLLRDTWRARHAFSKILIFHFKLKPNINIGEIGSSQNWWEFIDFNKMNAWLDLISTYLQGKGSIDLLTLGHCLKITIVWIALSPRSMCMLYFVHCERIQLCIILFVVKEFSKTFLVLRNGLILGVSSRYVLICNMWGLSSCSVVESYFNLWISTLSLPQLHSWGY